MDFETQKDLELAEKMGVELIPYSSPLYPAPLKQLADPPPVLYVKGALLPQDIKSIGIIGTRQCTIYGRESAERFAEGAASAGFTVVSGLARGIDTAAHIGALKSGRTIAVLGSGLAHIYPPENRDLADQIASSGALISEFPMDARPDKFHFPKRNRLVAALSQGLFLVEAPLKSGAMITMRLGAAQKKPCFALPGRVDSDSFKGNHLLIKSGKAQLVENYEEMLSILEPEGCIPPASKEIQISFIGLSPEEEALAAAFPQEEVSIEQISMRARLPITKLNSLLMGLVLKQIIREFPGKIYKKR